MLNIRIQDSSGQASITKRHHSRLLTHSQTPHPRSDIQEDFQCPFTSLALRILVEANVIKKKKHNFLPECHAKYRSDARPPNLYRVRDGVLPGLGYRWVRSNGGVDIRRGNPKGSVPTPIRPLIPTHEMNPDWTWGSTSTTTRRTAWILNNLNNRT